MNHTLQLHTHNQNLYTYCTYCGATEQINDPDYIEEWWETHLSEMGDTTALTIKQPTPPTNNTTTLYTTIREFGEIAHSNAQRLNKIEEHNAKRRHR